MLTLSLNEASWNFRNATIDLGGGDIVVSGYANNTEIPPSPFDAKDITIFTDGACTSTCGLFVNLLINQAKVKSVVAGGRPSYAPMALIGGSQVSSRLLVHSNVSCFLISTNAALLPV